MGYTVVFENTYMMCSYQNKTTDVPITLGIYHSFVLGPSKILSTRYFEIWDQSLAITINYPAVPQSKTAPFAFSNDKHVLFSSTQDQLQVSEATLS